MRKSHGSEVNRSRQPVGGHADLVVRNVRRLHDDEGGAILLFSLVSILILLLMTWTVMDSGQVARTKLQVQASADMAAYSQAAVKARSMNMLAYTNIAKRSVVGIHSLYNGMFEAYEEWLFLEYWPQCGSGTPGDASCDEVEKEVNQWSAERYNDREWFENSQQKYYMADLQALDNYQHYIINLTPWWGWTEAVVRAQRNSATMATSYPPPAGSLRKGFPDITNQVIGRVGSVGHHNVGNAVEMLPVMLSASPEINKNAMLFGGFEDPAFVREMEANASLHKQNSGRGAALDKNIADGLARAMNGGQMLSFQALSEVARPAIFLTWLNDDEKWLKATSNIVITFQEGDELFGKRRDNYRFPTKEYSLAASGGNEEMYRPKGFWSMARSEISFVPFVDKNGKKTKVPDMWHARWTARMRPMSLPNEFFYGGYNMNGMYYDIMPHLSLSLEIGANGSRRVSDYLEEMVWMERATRAMGYSTVEGVAK